MPNQNGQLRNGTHGTSNGLERDFQNGVVAEECLEKVVAGVDLLRKMNDMRISFEAQWSPSEVWKQGMVCFENHRAHALEFVKTLPGFDKLCQADRSKLFGESLFPITIAQLSQDYDLQSKKENYLSMDENGRELMVRFFPPIVDLRQAFHDAGVAVKQSTFNATELAFLAALLFFNSDIPNLVQLEQVCYFESLYKNALKAYVSSAYPDQKIVCDRVNRLQTLVKVFAGFQEVHQRVMAQFAQQFPSLVKLNQCHHEMFTKRFHS